MDDATGVLGLVTMLPTRSSSGVPLYAEVAIVKFDSLYFLWVYDCDSDGRRMNTSTFFIRWDSLNAMATGLFLKL
jgi:hypothetical protein